ncbi:MAG: ABC transporter substrate-binding protein [Lachnospiraceae bacterium]|nr:ABC transporter substrate-binding protein [Lachnospiraceae bacterium]
MKKNMLAAALVLTTAAWMSTMTFAQELTQVDVVLDWYPNAIHSFLYEAADAGYFEEEGLEVNLISPAESVDAVNFVAAGRAQIGLTYPVDVVTAQKEGMPVAALGAVAQGALDCMCSLAENDITEDLSSLAGKKIGHSGPALMKAVVRTVTENAGLSEGDYEVMDVGFDLITSLTTGNVDLIVGPFVNDEIVTMRNAGYDLNVFSQQDYGVPQLYGLVMAVNTEDYAERTDLYEGFVRACRKGFDDIAADKELAMDIIMNEMNSDDNPLDEAQQSESYDILMPIMQTEENAFLSMDAQVWQNVIDWMNEMELVDGEIEASAVMLEVQE